MKHQIPSLESLFHTSFKILLDGFTGLSFQGSCYKHPLFDTLSLLISFTFRNHVVISGYHVTEDTGTGIVHTAPPHGMDDFLACKYHNVITIPGVTESQSTSDIPRVTLPDDIPRYPLKEDVDEDGRYYQDVWTSRLQGKDVLDDGNREVVGAWRG